MNNNRYNHRVTTRLIGMLFVVTLAACAVALLPHFSYAQPTPTINYQGKLTDGSGLAVADGTYNMRFWLLQSTSQATTSAIWSEELAGANQVTVTNGLFSVMLGSTSALTSVNFDQPLYLGVEIGGTGAPAWDGEMLPRKSLGTVPAAFEAYELGGVASSSFLRSDQADTLTAATTSTLLTINQSGTGDILNLLDDGAEVFTVTDGGNVGIGTTNPTATLEVVGDIVSKGTSWATASAAGDDDNWNSITYGNGRFVAVSGFGDDRVMTSPDGVTWTVRSAAGDDDFWQGITYGNGLFVAVGNSGDDLVMTSPDGITWTARSAAGNNDSWNSITYGNGLFVAVSVSGDRVMTSPDGVTWTARSAAGDDDVWNSITYGNGLFVAVGGGGSDRVMTSPDGITWTARSAAGDNDDWWGVTYGNGLFVAVSVSGDRVMTSPDGITWTVRSAAGDDDEWTSITYGNGLFVAVGYSGDRVMTSPDGITWTARSAAGDDDEWYGATYGNGRFVAVGGFSADRVMYSGQPETTSFAANNIFQGERYFRANVGLGTTTASQLLTIDGNAYLTGALFDSTNASGTAGMVLQTTGDGTQWVATSSLGISGGSSLFTDGGASTYLTSLTDNVGIGTANPTAKLEVVGDIVSKGTSWATASAAGGGDIWSEITYGNGLFVVVGFSGDRVMTSPDGITWTARSAAGDNDGWNSITYGNGLFVAVGSSGDRVMTSPDGITWTARSAAGDDDGWFGITYGNGLFVAVSDSGDRVMTSPDGITWTARSAAGNNDQWEAITYGNGLFVAVGDSGDRVMTSPDGINWTTRSAAGDDDFWLGVTYGNGLFVAVGGFGDDRVMTSPDGITWTARSAAGDNDNWYSVTYGNGLFVAVGNSGDRVMTSPDGITWTARSAAGDNDSWYGIIYANGRFVAAGSSADGIIYSGQPETTSFAANNIFQGDRAFMANVGIGTSTAGARLTIESVTLDGAGVSGLDQYLTTTNSVASAVQYGNRFFLNASNTATTTVVGSVYRVADDTIFGNTVRGLEVQTNQGANTNGENTALSGFARTFGVRGVTTGDAGGDFEPAGGFFETEGTSQGNAVRGFSSSITSASLLSLFQDTSDFTGTGLQMNFGNTTGDFSSTTSKYLDFQNAGTSVFTVSAFGTTTIGDGTTTNMAGLQIGYGGICVDNDGSCAASTTGQISSVSSYTGNSDLAEMYFSNQDLAPGEIVTLAGELSVERAERGASLPVIGVVSTKPGLTLGFDDVSTRAGEIGYPLALKGRVPVQLSTENGPIQKGDQLMLSSLPGIAMKAAATGTVVGIALEDFDEDRMYSRTFINQFGDDMVDPVYDPVFTNTDPRIADGCYYGGGNAAGEDPCVPLSATTTAGKIAEVNDRLEEESVAEQLGELANVRSDRRVLPNGEQVRVGQVVMFVHLQERLLAAEQLAQVSLLTGTSSLTEVGEDISETVFDRLVALADRFIDGVFSVLELRAERVEVTQEICVDDVCFNAEDLRTMLDSSSADPQTTQVEEQNNNEEEHTEPVHTQEETETETESYETSTSTDLVIIEDLTTSTSTVEQNESEEAHIESVETEHIEIQVSETVAEEVPTFAEDPVIIETQDDTEESLETTIEPEPVVEETSDLEVGN